MPRAFKSKIISIASSQVIRLTLRVLYSDLADIDLLYIKKRKKKKKRRRKKEREKQKEDHLPNRWGTQGTRD